MTNKNLIETWVVMYLTVPYDFSYSLCPNQQLYTYLWDLGKPSWEKSAVFLNIVQKAFDPPPPSFEHHVVNFSEGILTKVRKHLSQWLSTK